MVVEGFKTWSPSRRRGNAERESISRRSFLKLGGASLVSVLVPGTLPAKAEGLPPLAGEFGRAARKYGVPLSLLMAMGYVNTRWEMPPPEASGYEKKNLHARGAYGIMALVQNPSSNTLGEAARLTGISEERLKTERAANIMGGAALLAASQGDPRPVRLADWYGAISGRGGHGRFYRAVSGVGGGDLYADQVFEALKSGASKRIKSGERLSLVPQSLGARKGAA